MLENNLGAISFKPIPYPSALCRGRGNIGIDPIIIPCECSMNIDKGMVHVTTSKGVPMLKKLGAIGSGLIVGAGSLMAGPSPVVPTTALEADYALFDYVFGAVILVSFTLMIAKRAKGFIR
jgi:hypothetical protein